MFSSKGFRGITSQLSKTIGNKLHLKKTANENDDNQRDSYEDSEKDGRSNGPQTPTSPDYQVTTLISHTDQSNGPQTPTSPDYQVTTSLSHTDRNESN